jgi:hypothetical protein
LGIPNQYNVSELKVARMKQFLVILFLCIISIKMTKAINASEKKSSSAVELNPYTKSLRSRFENAFVDKCQKYPFVKQWENKLEHTGDRYVTFMYHEPGLRNGGLGDRIGGLLNAMGIALRFNRTLLIESQNGFHDLFRPYHSSVVEGSPNYSADEKYTWNQKNWTDWTNWQKKYVDQDDTEYDMWWCINCVAWRNKVCAMDDKDVPHPNIKIRGNRSYLCKWASHPDIKAHTEFLDVIAPIGVTSYDQINMMEVAGCMMRLAMWPTNALWSYVSNVMEKHMGKEKVKVPSILQIGAHFRCGDWSYLKGNDDACIHDEDGTHPHTESSYMAAGTPVQIGKCVRDVLNNSTRNEFKPTLLSETQIKLAKIKDTSTSTSTTDINNGVKVKNTKRKLWYTNKKKNKSRKYLRRRLLTETLEGAKVVYIASDNPGSAQQINTTAKHQLTIVSPKGCHVEMDPSFDCSQLTIGYWLLLSSSDVIVTQTDKTGSPISAFSRYAAVYGLKGDSLRDAKDCANVKSFYDISRRWTGNWFCD